MEQVFNGENNEIKTSYQTAIEPLDILQIVGLYGIFQKLIKKEDV